MFLDELIQTKLIEYTIANSNFDVNRHYIGLSRISETPKSLVRRFFEGEDTNSTAKLKFYKGYQMEKDLIVRLQSIFPGRIKTGIEIGSDDRLILGHPDCSLDDFPVEIKSVLEDKWTPSGEIPNRIYWQIQGYLLYGGKSKGYIIFESRENGLIKVFKIAQNFNVQSLIKQKVNTVRALIKARLNNGTSNN